MAQTNQAPTTPAPADGGGVLAKWLKGEAGATLPPPPGNTESNAVPEPVSDQEGEWVSAKIKASDVQTDWGLGWHPAEIVEASMHHAKVPCYKITYRCFDGSATGKYKDDYWPIEGKGIVKTYRAAESIDLRNKDTGEVSIKAREQLIGKQLWIEMITKREEWNGEERDKEEIRFPNGYAHITAFQLPQQGDLFAETGQPIAVEVKNEAGQPPSF